MKFSFTDEQNEFRTVVRRFLEAKSSTPTVRKLMESEIGYDPDAWRQLSEDLGLTAVHIPEAFGGQGFGIGELAITVEEMGRSLLCAPFFSSIVLAATSIMKAGSEEQKRALLPGIASGKSIATLAVAETSGRWDVDGIQSTAVRSGSSFRIEGSKKYVVDGHTADMIVVAARAPGTNGETGVSLFTIRGDAKGLERRQLQTLDPTRKLAELTLREVQAELLGMEGGAARPLQDTLDIASICLANEMIGGAGILREAAITFAKMRVQFGRPIASFQSLKHKAADMLLDVELAKSAAYYAAAAVDDGDSDVPALASFSKAAASDAYMRTAIHAVQIHGGIGFTWDNDTQLWFKRAKSSEVFLGGSAFHRERLMRLWQI